MPCCGCAAARATRSSTCSWPRRPPPAGRARSARSMPSRAGPRPRRKTSRRACASCASGHFQQVKIYIDHSNFIRTWTQIVHNRDRPLEHDVDWATLPQVIMEETANGWRRRARARRRWSTAAPTSTARCSTRTTSSCSRPCCGMEQTTPDKLPLPIRLRKETVERWREENEAHKLELTRTHPERDRLHHGADLPPHAARGPAVLRATSRPAASRSRRRRCSTRTWRST